MVVAPSELPFPLPVPLLQCLLWQPSHDQALTEGSWVGGFAQLIGRPTRTVGYFFMSMWFWRSLPFALTEAASPDWPLVQAILQRNLLLFLVFYGGWHLFLYGRAGGKPLLRKLEQKRFNPQKTYNLAHDASWSCVGVLISSAFEIFMLHLFATGRAQLYHDFWAAPVRSVTLTMLIPYWMEFHFYWIHRGLHEVPGAYKWIHYLHHRSRSPGPFSGLSMHPVEHLVFFSSCLLPLAVDCHPIHFYFTLIYARLSPISGHDGFDKPAGGSLVHYLHHLKVNVNYGTPVVPFDRWFGTLDDGTEFRRTRWSVPNSKRATAHGPAEPREGTTEGTKPKAH
jgi:lathosterol oxidase